MTSFVVRGFTVAVGHPIQLYSYIPWVYRAAIPNTIDIKFSVIIFIVQSTLTNELLT